MTTEDIEKLSLEELWRIAEDPRTAVPDTLPARLEELNCAASLAGNGAAALDERPDVAAPARHPVHWLWGTVPAAALVAVACFLLLRQPHRPKDTFDDPTLAYIELTRAFYMLQEATQDKAETVVDFQETN